MRMKLKTVKDKNRGSNLLNDDELPQDVTPIAELVARMSVEAGLATES